MKKVKVPLKIETFAQIFLLSFQVLITSRFTYLTAFTLFVASYNNK